MAIRIITDSTSDISLDRQEELGITIVPLSVLFGEEEYVDGVDLSKSEFYRMLAQSPKLPTTAQVSPEQFIQIFEQFSYPEDQVIGIFIASKMSGTYQSAVIAKNMLNEQNIFLIDSENVTLGLAAMVHEAIRLRDAGKTAGEIYEHLNDIKPKIRLLASIDTLKYLKMGGRLSASSAVIGSVLQIKPVITIIDGEIKVIEKARGQKAAFSYIINQITSKPPQPDTIPVFGGSDCPELSAQLEEAVKNSVPFSKTEHIDIGTVVGTHTGPGCVGIAYITE